MIGTAARRRVIAPDGTAAGVSVRAILVSLAAFFAVMPVVRSPWFNFTAGDALFVVAALSTLMLPSKRRLALIKHSTGPLLVGFIGFIVLALGLGLSTVFAGRPERAIIVLVQYGFAYGLVAFVFGTASDTELVWITRAYVFGIALVAAVGTVLYYMYPIHEIREMAPGLLSGSRMGSLLANPNALGKNIGLAVGPLLYLWATNRIGTIPVAVFAIAALGGLVVSGSFGGAFTIGVALILHALWFLSRRNVVRLFAVVALVTAVIVAFDLRPPDMFHQRTAGFFQSGSIHEAGSYDGKVLRMGQAWDIASQSPWIGFGVDEYEGHFLKDNRVHNTYLVLLTEGGILALWGWLIMILAIASVGVIGLVRRGPQTAFASRALLATVGTFLFACITNTHVYQRFWVIPLLLLATLAARELLPAPRRTASTLNYGRHQ